MTGLEGWKELAATEFAHLGLQHLAYIKRVIVEDEAAYAIHAADGTPMAVLRDYEVALAAVRQHDLEPVSVH
jgi:hypothetical protein